MHLELEVIGNVIQPKYVELKDGKYIAKVNNNDLRTSSQNAAQWLWFQQIADKLNYENVPTTQILKADINWDKDKVKAMFIDPLIKVLYNKDSTTKLNKDQYDQLIDTITKAFGSKGISLPKFPSLEKK